MLSLFNLGLSEYAEKTRFWVYEPEYLRNIQEDIFWGTLDTYTKKVNPLSAVLWWGGGGGGGVRSAGL